jgi:hypothetical protein
MCLFSLQVTKNGIWKALMPSIRSRPECPKYGKKTYFGYSGRHQVHMNFQPSPPLTHMLQLLPRFLQLPNKKLCVTLNLFLFFKNFFKNLFLRKDNFRK